MRVEEEPKAEVPLSSEMRAATAPLEEEWEKMDKVVEIIGRRGVTLTEAILHPDRATKMRVMRAVTGFRYDENTGGESLQEQPAIGMVELQSLHSACPKCRDNSCGRQGKFHDIVYKTGTHRGNAVQLRERALALTPIIKLAKCAVDPDTGRFLHPVPVVEAIKIMREHGENIRKPRFRDKKGQTGDRWLVRDIAHYEKFGAPGIDAGTTEKLEPSISV